MEEKRFKYGEDAVLKDLTDYIAGTYGQHYANGVDNIQAFDAIIELDGAEAWRFFRNCALKYLWRFGKKKGFNQEDLNKVAHYLVLLITLTKNKEK